MLSDEDMDQLQYLSNWKEKPPMSRGTRSLLFGCHQFIIHPLFVLWAWVVVGGHVTWRYIIAIIVHDWGYWGCKTMDGEDGEAHPLFGSHVTIILTRDLGVAEDVLLHSRFWAARCNMEPSLLCWADKLGTALYPHWLWATLAYMSGEGWEYMDNTKYEIHDTTMEYNWRGLYEFHVRYRVFTKEMVAEEIS